MTTASPDASARIPPSLAGPARTSFGHLSCASTEATERTAAVTATPASSGSQPRRAGGTPCGRSRSENVRAARGGDTQARPSRPRPALCSSAASTAPSGAPIGRPGQQVGVGRAGRGGDLDGLPQAAWRYDGLPHGAGVQGAAARPSLG